MFVAFFESAAWTNPLTRSLRDGCECNENLARGLQIEGDLPFRAGGFWEIVGTAFIFLILDVVLYPIFGAFGGMIAASLTREPRA